MLTEEEMLEQKIQEVFKTLRKILKKRKEPFLVSFANACFMNDIEQVIVVQWLIFQGLEFIGKKPNAKV